MVRAPAPNSSTKPSRNDSTDSAAQSATQPPLVQPQRQRLKQPRHRILVQHPRHRGQLRSEHLVLPPHTSTRVFVSDATSVIQHTDIVLAPAGGFIGAAYRRARTAQRN